MPGGPGRDTHAPPNSAPASTIITLGHTGTITKYLTPTLKALGIPATAATTCSEKLHRMAVAAMGNIIRVRHAHARTSTHAALQVRLHRVGRPAPTPVCPSPLVQVRGQRLPPWPHVTAPLRRTQPRAAVAAWPSSAPCCRSTPAPAQLLFGGGASRWRQGSWSRSAASPLGNTHARLTLARVLSAPAVGRGAGWRALRCSLSRRRPLSKRGPA